MGCVHSDASWLVHRLGAGPNGVLGLQQPASCRNVLSTSAPAADPRSPDAGAQPPEVFQEAVQLALKEAGAGSSTAAAGSEEAANGGACTREGCT